MTITQEDAKDLLQFLGSFVHAEKCSYVQRGGECDCNRFRLYNKLRAIAYPAQETNAKPECVHTANQNTTWVRQGDVIRCSVCNEQIMYLSTV
jgi:hypothetical protein